MSDRFMKLITDLQSSNKNKRANAAKELGKLGDERCVGNLMPLLNDPWGPAAWEAYKSILQLENVGAIARAYEIANNIEQMPEIFALKSLAGMPQPKVNDGLNAIEFNSLSEKEKSWVRSTLLSALKNNSDQKAIAIIGLSRFLKDTDIKNRFHSFLYDKTPVLCSSLNMAFPLLGLPQSSVWITEIAAQYLIMAKDEDTAKRIFNKVLEDWWETASWPEMNDQKPKDKFIKFMYDQGWSWVIDKLGEYVNHQNETDRLRAIRCLVIIDDPRSLQALEGFLKDENKQVKKTALKAIESWKKTFSNLS